MASLILPVPLVTLFSVFKALCLCHASAGHSSKGSLFYVSLTGLTRACFLIQAAEPLWAPVSQGAQCLFKR